MIKRVAALLTAGAVMVLAVTAASRRWLRGRLIAWGATPDEVTASLPGDELLEDAEMISTRAISIDAPPSAVYPWLVQMGVGRGGAYTYDWTKNLLGLDMHSVDRIVPELMIVIEPGSLVMERKMLLGIKQRAEEPAASMRSEGAS